MQAKTIQPLHQMFTAVPQRYDLINHVITLGMDNSWRQRAAIECLASKPARILDVCCGTGDLALRLARMTGAEIEALDFSEPMLEIARAKAMKLPPGGKVNFTHGDVSALPYPDACFDCVGISFAFRNLTYRNPMTGSYLSEIFRVLKPGGRFVIVESSQPRSLLICLNFQIFLRCFVYPAGRLLSGNAGAYRYLATSARNFYSPEQVRDLLLGAGFASVRYEEMFFGAAGVHVAKKE